MSIVHNLLIRKVRSSHLCVAMRNTYSGHILRVHSHDTQAGSTATMLPPTTVYTKPQEESSRGQMSPRRAHKMLHGTFSPRLTMTNSSSRWQGPGRGVSH